MIGCISLEILQDFSQKLPKNISIKNWKIEGAGLPVGAPLSTLETNYRLYGAHFAPDEKSVLAIGRGSNVNRYPLNDTQLGGKKVVSLDGHSQTVLDAHFIPQADAAITVGSDAELYVWDLSNDKALFSLRLPSHRGVPMPFSHFSSSCNKGGCRFAVPLKGKRNEEGRVVIYDFTFRSRVE